MLKQTVADRNLAMEAVRVTEAAALAASLFMGGGDEKAADQAALDAMQATLGSLTINGTVRIGEGLEGEARRLYVGEKVGIGKGTKAGVAIVPLEGKSIVARGGPNALSVIAMAEDGGFLSVPDIYMEKIAIGPGLPDGVIGLDASVSDNLNNLATAKGIGVADLVVCLLDRPRHGQLVSQIRDAGAWIRLILDDDVAGVIATVQADSGVAIYMGIGGAPQGVLAAACLRGVGGQMQGRLVLRNGDERAAAQAAGIDDWAHTYSIDEMATGNITFAATGVTYGALLKGVRTMPGGAITHSMVVRSVTGTLRYIEAHHDFSRQPRYG